MQHLLGPAGTELSSDNKEMLMTLETLFLHLPILPQTPAHLQLGTTNPVTHPFSTSLKNAPQQFISVQGKRQLTAASQCSRNKRGQRCEPYSQF